MVKRVVVSVLALLVAIGALYGVARTFFQVDGSGMWPRYSRGSNFDALDADRARQRADAPPAGNATPASTDAPSAAAAPSLDSSRPGDSASSPSSSIAAPSSPADAAPAVAAGSSALTMSGAATPSVAGGPGVWPDFRGQRRDGRFDAAPIRVDWPSGGLPRLWKQPIGLGYASFVAAGGRAFTIEQRRNQEVVAAYDVATGRELWTNGWPGEFRESMGGDGPRATPTLHEGRLYALGALGEFRCLDAATGKVLWRRNILEDTNASNLPWGVSGAPLIVDDLVVVLPGGTRGKSVAAYDRQTGAPRWTALDDVQAYVSPMLVTLAGTRQILVVSATRAVGLTTDGTLLWEFPWRTDMGINVAQPLLLGGDRVFLSASYGKGAGVFEVRREGERFTTRAIWANQRMKNKFTSPLLKDGYVYGLDESILACIDAATGDQKWKGGRYGYGQVMLAGEHLIVLTEDGDAVLVKATPERHEEVARFSAIEGKTWNHPVIVDGRLLVRNLQEMAAYDIRP